MLWLQEATHWAMTSEVKLLVAVVTVDIIDSTDFEHDSLYSLERKNNLPA